MLLSVLPSDFIKNAPKFSGKLDMDSLGASLRYDKQELSISTDLTRARYENSLDKPRRVEGSFDVAGKLTLGRITIHTPNDDPPVYQAITTATTQSAEAKELTLKKSSLNFENGRSLTGICSGVRAKQRLTFFCQRIDFGDCSARQKGPRSVVHRRVLSLSARPSRRLGKEIRAGLGLGSGSRVLVLKRSSGRLTIFRRRAIPLRPNPFRQDGEEGGPLRRRR